MAKRRFLLPFLIVLFGLTGCWAAAIGAGGAEAGYVLTQADRSAGETIDDQRITASVKSRLLADPDVSGLNINVDTFKKVVTLQGTLDSDDEVREAIQLSEAVSGVREVRSRIKVAR